VTTIVDFKEPYAAAWTIVNDGVMGGRSSSEMEVTPEGNGVFRGFVSLENNGGFASTRMALAGLDLSEYEGVMIRVRGDGRRYQFRFRTSGSFDGVAYRADFDTVPQEWVEVRLPFADFQASFRGRVPRGAGPLDPSRIRQMGFLIGDKREGPFRLEIAWVGAYGERG
jgi:hypothetical protein